MLRPGNARGNGPLFLAVDQPLNRADLTEPDWPA